MSIRRACRVLEFDTSSYHYKARRRDQAGIEARIRERIGFDQLKQQFLGRGASESFAQGYVDMYRAKNEGMDNAAADGAARQPTSFRGWAEVNLKQALAG